MAALSYKTLLITELDLKKTLDTFRVFRLVVSVVY